MQTNLSIEAWQRGPLPGIIPLLMPAAHAIMQAKEDVTNLLRDFPESKLWDGPAGLASVAFHIQHMAGVLDRLFTYAKGLPLDEVQLFYLQKEGKTAEDITVKELIHHFHLQVDKAMQQLQTITEEELLSERGIGRKQIPTNVIGLVFHAAEHLQRHCGQLLVTAKIVEDNFLKENKLKGV